MSLEHFPPHYSPPSLHRFNRGEKSGRHEMLQLLSPFLPSARTAAPRSTISCKAPFLSPLPLPRFRRHGHGRHVNRARRLQSTEPEGREGEAGINGLPPEPVARGRPRNKEGLWPHCTHACSSSCAFSYSSTMIDDSQYEFAKSPNVNIVFFHLLCRPNSEEKTGKGTAPTAMTSVGPPSFAIRFHSARKSCSFQ